MLLGGAPSRTISPCPVRRTSTKILCQSQASRVQPAARAVLTKKGVLQDLLQGAPMPQETRELERVLETHTYSRPELQRNQLAERVQALLLAGGDSHMPVASTRAVAALPYGANLRVVDIPIHNMVASGINKMYVLSQFHSHTLFSHLTSSYPMILGSPRNAAFVEPLACTQTATATNWYRGAAEAVARNIDRIAERGGEDVEDFVIASGTAIYNLDILDVVNTHRRQNADITVVTRSVCRSDAERLGVVVVNQDSGLLQSFVEKPQDPILAELANTSSHTTAALPYEANQGVYVFRRDTLLELLADKDERTAHVQFGRDVLPAALSWGLTVAVHHNDGHWHELADLHDFYSSSLSLMSPDAPIQLEEVYANTMRCQQLLPPSRILGGLVDRCLVGEGSIIRDAVVRNCVVGTNSYIARGCTVEDTVLLGNSQYQSCSYRDEERAAGRPVQGVGEGSTVKGAVIDMDASIGPGSFITNADRVQEADRSDQGFIIQQGLVTVLRNAALAPGTRI